MTIEIRNHGSGHSYRRVETGEKVPGVTTALSGGVPKPGLYKWYAETAAAYAVDNWERLAALPPVERYNEIRKAPYRKLNEAGVKGTTAHKFAERILSGETVDVPPHLIGYVRAAATFIEEFDFQPVYIEVVVHSADEHDHGGKVDGLGTIRLPDLPEYDHIERDADGRVWVIIDWKTGASGIFGEVAYQLAAYRHSLHLVTPDGEEVDMPEVKLCVAVHLTPDGYSAVALETDEAVYRDFLFIKEVSRITEESKYLVLGPLVPPRTARYAIEEIR